GRAAVEVRGRTIADVLRAVVDECPRLVELVAADGSVSGQFLVSVDGERFVRDTTEVIRRGSRLLILGAEAGGGSGLGTTAAICALTSPAAAQNTYRSRRTSVGTSSAASGSGRGF